MSVPTKLADITSKSIVFTTKPVKYIILSYVWGDKRGQTVYGINGNLPVKLDNLLQRAEEYAMTQGIKYLWIDCLCIDQTNTDELNTEVRNMAYYYKNADECLVLIDDNIYMKDSIQVISKLPIDEYIYSNISEEDVYSMLNTTYRGNVMGICDVISPHIKNMETVLNDIWFERVWTLQEYHLPSKLKFLISKDVHINRKRFMILVSAIIILFVRRGQSMGLDAIYRLSNTTAIKFGSSLTSVLKSDLTFSAAVSLLNNRSCEKKEDMIYGISGLLGYKITYNYGRERKYIFSKAFEDAVNAGDMTVMAFTGPQSSVPIFPLMDENFSINDRYSPIIAATGRLDIMSVSTPFPGIHAKMKIIGTITTGCGLPNLHIGSQDKSPVDRLLEFSKSNTIGETLQKLVSILKTTVVTHRESIYTFAVALCGIAMSDERVDEQLDYIEETEYDNLGIDRTTLLSIMYRLHVDYDSNLRRTTHEISTLCLGSNTDQYWLAEVKLYDYEISTVIIITDADTRPKIGDVVIFNNIFSEHGLPMTIVARRKSSMLYEKIGRTTQIPNIELSKINGAPQQLIFLT